MSFFLKTSLLFIVLFVLVIAGRTSAEDKQTTSGTDTSGISSADSAAQNDTASKPQQNSGTVSDEDNPVVRSSDLTILQDIVDDKIKRTVNSSWTINLSGYGAIGFNYSQRALKPNPLKEKGKEYDDGAFYFRTPLAGITLKGKLREDPILDGDLNYNVSFLLSGTSFSFADLTLTWDIISNKRGNGLPYTLNVTAGQFLVPFSSDNLAGEDKKPTINYAQYFTSWKLGRDIGIRIDQGFFNTTDIATGSITPKIALTLALVNGSGANALDSLRNKDFISKVIVSPIQSFTNILGQFSFGGSVHLKNIDKVDKIIKFPVRRYSAEVNWLKQPFLLTGEYVYGDESVAASTKGRNSHNRIASRGFVGTAFYTHKPLSHIQPLFRFDFYDANDITPGDFNRFYTIGFNTFIFQTHPAFTHDFEVVAGTRVVKIQTNFTIKQEAKGKKLNNNELGILAFYSF